MTRWTYETVQIRYRRDGWTVEQEDAPTTVANILNTYGKEGWELVNLVPEYWTTTTVDGYDGDVQIFRAVFKRIDE